MKKEERPEFDKKRFESDQQTLYSLFPCPGNFLSP